MRFLIFSIALLLTQNILAQHNVQIVAHRGANRVAPENTIPAFLKAYDLGVDAVEIDIRETSDGELVVIHDNTLNRTTNGKGKVSESTLAYIQSLDGGSWFSKEYSGTKIPTLREVLRSIDGKVCPDLDFKKGSPEKLVALLKEEGYLDGKHPITLYSNDKQKLKKINQLAPAIKCRTHMSGTAKKIKGYKEDFGLAIANFYSYKLKKSYVRKLHKQDEQAFVDLVNFGCKNNLEDKFLKALKLNVDYIQVDEIQKCMPLLKAYSSKQESKNSTL